MSACLSCSARVGKAHRFCQQCGARIHSESTAADAGTPVREPRLGMPRAARASRSMQLKMQPERKQVSVLFVDLCDSTAHVAHSDPEEARAYLDDALRLMTDAVEAYGGTVSQLLGDGLLALFGAPVAQEDHALRACLAAISMHSAVRDRANQAQTRPYVLRMGIHSGEVIVGVAGHYLWTHYRADGSTIHLASRLERLAEPG